MRLCGPRATSWRPSTGPLSNGTEATRESGMSSRCLRRCLRSRGTRLSSTSWERGEVWGLICVLRKRQASDSCFPLIPQASTLIPQASGT